LLLELAPSGFESLDDLVEPGADTLGLDDELLDLLLQEPLLVAGPRWRRLRNDGADPRPDFEQTFLNQVLDDQRWRRDAGALRDASNG